MASRFIVPFSTRGDPFLSLHREMNRLFDDTFRSYGGDEAGQRGNFAAPALDVHESDGEYCVTADLPGVAESDIDLRIEGDMLTIRGEKQQRDERDERGYRVMERSSGSFVRSLRLPFEPDPEKVTAECSNGVLTVHVAKEGRQERSRRIEVRPGEGAAKTIEQKPRGANDEAEQPRQQAAQESTAQRGASSTPKESDQPG